MRCVNSTPRAAGYEPRLAQITNDFDVSYALVQAIAAMLAALTER